jgi:hypothetical protein
MSSLGTNSSSSKKSDVISGEAPNYGTIETFTKETIIHKPKGNLVSICVSIKSILADFEGLAEKCRN